MIIFLYVTAVALGVSIGWVGHALYAEHKRRKAVASFRDAITQWNASMDQLLAKLQSEQAQPRRQVN